MRIWAASTAPETAGLPYVGDWESGFTVKPTAGPVSVCWGFWAGRTQTHRAARTPVGDTMARDRIPAIRDVPLPRHVRVEDGITEPGRA